MIVRARILLPIAAPPIEDALLWLGAGRVRALGRWRDLRPHLVGPVEDLGDVVLLPGLVNPHCHLDYTDMAGQIVPTRSFTDWIKNITTLKAGWGYSDFAQSWIRGAQMLVRNGCTTVGDIEASFELLPEAWDATPLRVVSFLEMTGVRSRRSPQSTLDEALQCAARLPRDRCRVGLSPHAPYSTTPELLRLTAQAARQRRLRLAIHVAESEEESRMFGAAEGALFNWIARNERPMGDCGHGSPVAHLERCGLLGDDLMAVHANYLAEGDVQRLAAHGVHVVHCPRSHAYFQHGPFPLGPLREAGVNVCLGTDSLATVLHRRREPPELSLFAEMQALRSRESSLPPGLLLRMATLDAARALGLDDLVGHLSPGAAADLIAIPFAGALTDAPSAAVDHQGPVCATMIDGQWIKPASEPSSARR